jgi:hypothetical protein
MVDPSSYLHFVVSLLTTLIISKVTKSTVRIIIIAAIIGVGKELVDDKFDYFDLLFDAAGILIALLFIQTNKSNDAI